MMHQGPHKDKHHTYFSAKDYPSAYLVDLNTNEDEICRLGIQDQLVTTMTASLRGLVPEVADPHALRNMLDVGCGTGFWLRELAQTYPSIEKLIGVDSNRTLVKSARGETQTHHLDHRVEFQVMDALLMLEFPASSFDLVNQRFGVSWLRMFEWEKILMEYHRVTRGKGLIRITEGEMIESNSLALTKLCDHLLSALYYSGRFFTRRSNGLTQELVRLMVQHGIRQVQKEEYRLSFKGCTPECEMLCENIRLGFRTLLPFFHRWIRINPSEYEDLYAQALQDIHQPHFEAQWLLVTVWGSKGRSG